MMTEASRAEPPFYFEYQAVGWQHYDSESWGACRRLIEVFEDQYAARQIDFYVDGRVLVYDREHARDSFGMLNGLKFSKKAKWRIYFNEVRMMDASSFEKLWRRASRDAVNRQDSATRDAERQ